MPRFVGKSAKKIGLVVLVILLILTIKLHSYEHNASVFLARVQPTEVWEYVADFSNMKHLNPTIIDFAITDESGNYDHWKYTAEYTEHLSHWPYIRNNAVAQFNVKTIPSRKIHVIESVHRTCFMKNMFCVNSESQFRFARSNSSKGTLCQETVLYQCPMLLSALCKREVVFQRNAIMHNLRHIFK